MNKEIELLNNKLDAQDKIINNQALEIARLKEALEIKYYCKYANKCNELYDCTREEYETMALSNMKLDLENAELQQRIDKAIEKLKEIEGCDAYIKEVLEILEYKDEK